MKALSQVENAAREMKLVGFDDEDTVAITGVMQRFYKQFNSGGSVSVMLPVLARLFDGLPLTPVEDKPEEWIDRTGEGTLLQHARCSSLFKSTSAGLCFFIDDSGGNNPPLIVTEFPFFPPHAMDRRIASAPAELARAEAKAANDRAK